MVILPTAVGITSLDNFKETGGYLQPSLWHQKLVFFKEELRTDPVVFTGSQTISTGDHGDQNRDYEPNYELFITLTECFLWLKLTTCTCDVRQLLPHKDGVDGRAQRFYCTFSSWRSHIFHFLVVWNAAQEWELVSHGKKAWCTRRCAHNLLIWIWTLSRLLQDTSFSLLGCFFIFLTQDHWNPGPYRSPTHEVSDQGSDGRTALKRSSSGAILGDVIRWSERILTVCIHNIMYSIQIISIIKWTVTASMHMM